jgi:hypothetical protein
MDRSDGRHRVMATLSTSTAIERVFEGRSRLVILIGVGAIAAAATILAAWLAISLLADTTGASARSGEPSLEAYYEHVLRENNPVSGASLVSSYYQHVLRENDAEAGAAQ